MAKDYLKRKQALLLDMNSTFMFDEDRFGDTQDYSRAYSRFGGTLPDETVNRLVREVCEYLTLRYPDPAYRENFPTISDALATLADIRLSQKEVATLARTFAAHERGRIPQDYLQALRQLASQFRLGLVIDIWAPKADWLSYFSELGITGLFEAMSFSSDHGHVKPSPFGFRQVLRTMNLQEQDALFIGDSVRRDLGGARKAGLDCVLVGGSKSDKAVDAYPDLLALCKDWFA